MARGTTRQFLNLIFGDELLAELELVRGRLVIDAEDRRSRADVALRAAMAVEAPFHLQRLVLRHERHAIDLAVAGGAADALVHVDAVVEVDEVWQIMDARPLDRLAGPETLAHRLEERAFREDLRMAVHAGFRRRDAGERGVFDGGVAVAAVDAVAGDVALVAELDRLLARDARVGHPG